MGGHVIGSFGRTTRVLAQVRIILAFEQCLGPRSVGLRQRNDVSARSVRFAVGGESGLRLMDLDHAKSENVEHLGRVDGIFLLGRNHESVEVLPLHCLLSDQVEVSQQTFPVARGRCQTGTEGDELVSRQYREDAIAPPGQGSGKFQLGRLAS